MSEDRIPVIAPILRAVVQLNVKLGDRVDSGQTVVTLMSMKTEFKVEASQPFFKKSGRVEASTGVRANGRQSLRRND